MKRILLLITAVKDAAAVAVAAFEASIAPVIEPIEQDRRCSGVDFAGEPVDVEGQIVGTAQAGKASAALQNGNCFGIEQTVPAQIGPFVEVHHNFAFVVDIAVVDCHKHYLNYREMESRKGSAVVEKIEIVGTFEMW